jgi:glycosyltransferase involved in cell wall biosynthesis
LCVDACPTENPNRLRGIGSVAREVLAAMPALSGARGVELSYVRRRRMASSSLPWYPRSWPYELSSLELPFFYRFAPWLQPADTALALPRDVAASRADVFLATDPQAVALSSAFATVAVLYDILPLLMPEMYLSGPLRPAKTWRYQRQLARMRRADRLVAISQATKDDAVRLAGFDAARITVVPLAVDRDAFPAADPAAAGAYVARRFAVTRPYLLFVGASDPRKNLDGLIVAYEMIAADRDVDLVIAGQRPPNQPPAPTAGRVHWVGHVSAADLAWLYSGAAAFVFPTLYEGFGLPILEAMSAGTPVITTPLSSIPEVAGDAALYADPRDPAALATVLGRVLDDAGLRAELRRRGFDQVGRFSWTRTADETLAVCREAAEARARES